MSLSTAPPPVCCVLPHSCVLCVAPPPPGPVDAAYKAIDGLVRVDAELVDYSVNSVTEGIQVRDDMNRGEGRTHNGPGSVCTCCVLAHSWLLL